MDNLTVRNASLADMADMLRTQHARKLDVVAPATAIRAEGGNIVLAGTEGVLTDDGVSNADGIYRPTEVMDGHIAAKLGIPRQYLRKMREERPDLFDANVNGWLHGDPENEHSNPDPRSFLVRTFRGDSGDPHAEGVGRSLMSDRYGIVDNMDLLMAALDGVKQAGVTVAIPEGGADLTDSHMYCRIVAPQIQAYAPDLLRGYRSPFDTHDARDVSGRWTPGSLSPVDKPIVFAGFSISNSEVGQGRFTIAPVIVFQVCGNGLTIKKDVVSGIHVGGKMEEGIVRWSKDTERKTLALVTAKTADAVATFLDVDYVHEQIAKLEAFAGHQISDPVKAIEFVSKTLKYSESEQTTILDHFIKGGQTTAGGVMQAVTSTAQVVQDPEDANRLELSAVEALQLAATR